MESPGDIMTRSHPGRRATLAAALITTVLGTTGVAVLPAHAEDTSGIVLYDQVSRSGADGKYARVLINDRVTYPAAGGRGQVFGSAVAESNRSAPASPTTLSSYYTVRRVADARWQGRMWSGSTSSDGRFSVGGLTAYRSAQSLAGNPSVNVFAELTAFMPIGAEIEHSATATFTPSAGVRITVTALDRHPLF
jgi:hypothetical protein